MPLFNCPHCQAECDIPEQLLGHTLECPGCLNQFTIPAPQPAAPPPIAPTPPTPGLASRIIDAAKYAATQRDSRAEAEREKERIEDERRRRESEAQKKVVTAFHSPEFSDQVPKNHSSIFIYFIIGLCIVGCLLAAAHSPAALAGIPACLICLWVVGSADEISKQLYYSNIIQLNQLRKLKFLQEDLEALKKKVDPE